MKTNNWPHGTNLGHPNFTGRTSSVPSWGESNIEEDSDRLTFKQVVGAMFFMAGFIAALLLAQLFE